MGIEAIDSVLDRSERMETMDSIASTAMGYSAARMAVDMSTSVEKKAMEMEELAAQEMFAMMPPRIPLGQYIDTYA